MSLGLYLSQESWEQGIPGWLSGLAPAFGSGCAILESRDRVPRRAPCMEPASPSAFAFLSLNLSLE